MRGLLHLGITVISYISMSESYLVETIPITRAPIAERLNYFSSDRGLLVATIAFGNVGNTLTPQLVMQFKPLSKDKSAIKALSYRLRPLKTGKGLALDSKFIEVVQKYADYHVVSLGHALAGVLPAKLLRP